MATLLSATRNGSHCPANNEDPARAKTLTVEQATALVERKGSLQPAVTELTSADVAAILAGFKGELRFEALATLTPEAAAALAKHGGSLTLGSLKTLTSLPLAERLGRQEWVALGVSRLTPEIAAALCPPSNREKFKNHVQFNIAITELPADVAAAIMAGRGHISANSLESISDEAAAAWSGPFANIRLFGLKTLSPAAAVSLAKGLGIFDIRMFGPELSDETAAALAKQMQTGPCRMVDLNGLKRLSSPELAVAALQREGQGNHSRLGGVAEITDDVAAALATHKGKIDLSGLKEISDVAAQSFAKAQGPVILTALEKASPTAIAALRSNAAITLPATLAAP